MKIFVPLTDTLSDRLMDQLETLGLTMDDLVPFDLDYEVLRPEKLADEVNSAATGAAETA